MDTTLDNPAATPGLPVGNAAVQYAGFWKRFLASLLDGLVLGAGFTVLMLLLMLVGGAFPGIGGSGPAARGILIILYLFLIAGAWLYSAILQSSKLQATVGKLALGLRVTDLEGRRISFARATGRFFANWLSDIILFIGDIMIAFTAKKQALHDIIAGTLVLTVRPAVPAQVAENATVVS